MLYEPYPIKPLQPQGFFIQQSRPNFNKCSPIAGTISHLSAGFGEGLWLPSWALMHG